MERHMMVSLTVPPAFGNVRMRNGKPGKVEIELGRKVS